MTRALLPNLRGQQFEGEEGGQGSIEFIIVDNASGPNEEEHLAALENQDDVTLIRSAQNSGYAVGMNMACERARGRYVLVINPDVMAFRGCLAALFNHLRQEEQCGMVGPRGFLDPSRFFQLPPVELPSLWSLKSEGAARVIPAWGRWHARQRTRRALDAWTATGPREVSMLSGFCFLMDRDLAQLLGPFDPGYPFYFEDADLSMRLRRRGFTCVQVPRAEMVHFYNRSAGQDEQAALARYAVSRRRFYRQRYSALGASAYNLTRFVVDRLKKERVTAEVESLGVCEGVPVIDVPGSGAYVAEISADPTFVFAAGRLDVTRRFAIPPGAWHGLVPSTYYVRFLKRRDLSLLRMVSLVKETPSQPVTAGSAAAELVHS